MKIIRHSDLTWLWSVLLIHAFWKSAVGDQQWVQPIPRGREEGECHLLINELRNDPDRFQVRFRMAVVQFDMLPALTPHIKGRRIQLSAIKLILKPLYQLWNVFYKSAKRSKSNPLQTLKWQTNIVSVSMCDTRSYMFLNIKPFWNRICIRCAKTLSVYQSSEHASLVASVAPFTAVERHV